MVRSENPVILALGRSWICKACVFDFFPYVYHISFLFRIAYMGGDKDRVGGKAYIQEEEAKKDEAEWTESPSNNRKKEKERKRN